MSGYGCPHCRVVMGPHDDGCPWHPSADAATERAEDLAERNELLEAVATAALQVVRRQHRDDCDCSLCVALRAAGFDTAMPC